jgi:hypothetical protein
MPTPRSPLPPTLRPSSSTPESLPINGPGSSYFKRRSFIYAAGFAVITIAGTLIGATLKSRAQAEEKEKKKMAGGREKMQMQEADTVGEQIAVLEATRSSLLVRKGQIERKIGEVRERERKEVEVREERRRLREMGDELKREMALGRGRG